MFILIDNYDSFTWNLWHFLSDLGAEVEIVRNDAATPDECPAPAAGCCTNWRQFSHVTES